MALDITKLAGYRADMTADEKLGLLTTYEPPTLDTTGYIQKTAFDKTASELAEAKRQLKAKLTEDEQKEAERAAAELAIKTELETLRKDKTTTEIKSKFLGLGYDEKLATATAAAFAEGNMEQFFANQTLHIENIKKVSAASAMAGETKPPAGSGSAGGVDYAKLISDAQANSDFGTAAMLTRQYQESIRPKT